jgi:hypothetical protein
MCPTFLHVLRWLKFQKHSPTTGVGERYLILICFGQKRKELLTFSGEGEMHYSGKE